MSATVFFIVDAAKIPSTLASKLRDGGKLCLLGVDRAEDALIATLIVEPLDVGVTVLCRLCSTKEPKHIAAESTYEYAEAKAIRHLRQKHSIFTSLWRYDENLIVHPIS